jgi:hypothetical protein
MRTNAFWVKKTSNGGLTLLISLSLGTQRKALCKGIRDGWAKDFI